jgi:hypothetical protein
MAEESTQDSLFECIPDLGGFLSGTSKFIEQELKCCRPNGNQIYSILYASGQSAILLSQGIPSSIQDKLEDWYLRLGITIILPWVIILVALFIALMVNRTISISIGVVFIIATIGVAAIALWLILDDALTTSSYIYNSTLSELNTNWKLYEEDIAEHLAAAYTLTASCNPDEKLSCCGFDDTNCTLIGEGCSIQFWSIPNYLLTGTTGVMKITIKGIPRDFGLVTGSIQIPPDLNNGVPANVKVSVQFGETFVEDFVYNIVKTPTTPDDALIANLSGAGGKFELRAPVYLVSSGI